MALAEEPVGHDELEARGFELFLRRLIPIRGEQPLVILRILDEVGAVQDADIGHEIRQVARVCDVHHIRALPDHLVDFLAGAELLAGENLDLDTAVGARADAIGEELGGQVGRLRG